MPIMLRSHLTAISMFLRVMPWCLAMMLLSGVSLPATAQRPTMMPPAFAGGIPGMLQMQALFMQRHQARTLLYRQAIEELRKNPRAADVPACTTTDAHQTMRTLCIRRPKEVLIQNTSSHITENPSRIHKNLGNLATNRRRLALLIGNRAYTAPIPTLNTPHHNIDTLARVLQQQFGYETRQLRDASKSDIIHAINRIAEEAGTEDSVLLFYAGHGYLIEDTRQGYWIPVDASEKTATHWISNSDISQLLLAIGARQVMLISDSCFSGSLTREQKMSTNETTLSAQIYAQRAVVAMSSGDEEPVSDDGREGHSIFAWHLLNTLRTVNGATNGHGVFLHVQKAVQQDYPQEPQYGGVMSAGHINGGDYLFDTHVP